MTAPASPSATPPASLPIDALGYLLAIGGAVFFSTKGVFNYDGQLPNNMTAHPRIDPETGETFHTGNFLAQYTAIAMDSTRYLIGLMCKHIDSQIALNGKVDEYDQALLEFIAEETGAA